MKSLERSEDIGMLLSKRILQITTQKKKISRRILTIVLRTAAKPIVMTIVYAPVIPQNSKRCQNFSTSLEKHFRNLSSTEHIMTGELNAHVAKTSHSEQTGKQGRYSKNDGQEKQIKLHKRKNTTERTTKHIPVSVRKM